jgi:hypothetical protein
MECIKKWINNFNTCYLTAMVERDFERGGALSILKESVNEIF